MNNEKVLESLKELKLKFPLDFEGRIKARNAIVLLSLKGVDFGINDWELSVRGVYSRELMALILKENEKKGVLQNGK